MRNTSTTHFKAHRLSIPLKALSAFLAAVMFFWPVTPVLAGSLPTGANVVKGQVTITVNGKTMTIDQATAKAIINWDSFDVGSGYTVDISQISKNAAMLARVVGSTPSEIYGALRATGGLYLVNPNGILFGSGAVIDVNKLIASTYDIKDEDFWGGNLRFQGDSTASVVNNAVINAASAALIARNVENHGTIQANQAALVGATGPVALDNFGNGGKLSLDLSGLMADSTEATVVNDGTIQAPGGQVVLTADAGRGLVQAQEGTVVASFAEFSGKNSALNNLGNLPADAILIDPVASLVIGNTPARDTGAYQATHPNVATGTLPSSVDSLRSSSSNSECSSPNITLYDSQGNGWTFTYTTETYNDGMGVEHIRYNYGPGVLTYYYDDNLTNALVNYAVALDYDKGTAWKGDITLNDAISMGGTYDLPWTPKAF